MNAPAAAPATSGARFRAAAQAKRAQFEMVPDAVGEPTAAPEDTGGASITLALVGPDGQPMGDIGTVSYDGDAADVEAALAGVQIVFSSPDVVDLAPLQSALEGLGITEANLNEAPPEGIPPEGGTYGITVVGGGGGDQVTADPNTPAPEFTWRKGGEVFKAGAADDEPSASSIALNNPKWKGLLVVEGIKSGDGRQIDLEALTWRNLPLPLMMMTENPIGGEGHDGAKLAGRIDWIERRENGEIWGGGVLDAGSDAGQEAMRLLTPDPETGFAMLRGVSVDLDDVEMAFDGPEVIDIEQIGEAMSLSAPMRVARGRVMGATLTPFPAFQEAEVVLVSDNALVAALTGGDCDCEHEATLVASCGEPMRGAQVRVFTPFGPDGLVASAGELSPVIPLRPPVAWFECPAFDLIADEPVRITADGRIYGLAADAKSCHIGFRDRCVQTPKSRSNYSYFANKQCETAEKIMVPSGPIFMDTVHPSLRRQASDAQAFYADTGCAVADVRAYDTPKGMYIAGAVRPSATPAQIRALRGSDISPDWRVINGHLECVALLAVNTSGFITPALVASAGEGGLVDSIRPGKVAAEVSIDTGEILALVAAGMKPHRASASEAQVEALTAEVASLRAEFDSMMAERLAERRAVAAGPFQARRAARQAALDARFAEARRRFARS